jgi:hypothetical protein
MDKPPELGLPRQLGTLLKFQTSPKDKRKSLPTERLQAARAAASANSGRLRRRSGLGAKEQRWNA